MEDKKQDVTMVLMVFIGETCKKASKQEIDKRKEKKKILCPNIHTSTMVILVSVT